MVSLVEFDAALVEMMIRHRNRQSSGEPDGMLRLYSLFILCESELTDGRNIGYCTAKLTEEGRVPG